MSNNEFHIQSSIDTLLLTFDEQWPQESYKNRFGKSLLNEAKKLKKSRWALIDDISNWPIKTASDINNCSEIATTLAEMGFQHCAVCGQKYAISKWMMNKVIPDDVEIAFFDSINESKEWLNSLGYHTNFA